MEKSPGVKTKCLAPSARAAGESGPPRAIDDAFAPNLGRGEPGGSSKAPLSDAVIGMILSMLGARRSCATAGALPTMAFGGLPQRRPWRRRWLADRAV